MSIVIVKEKIQQLRTLLKKHNHLYYVLDRPEVTDFEYDVLMTELIDLENKYPEFNDPLSPTKRVGGGVLEKFNTVTHSSPMLSLDNTYSEIDLELFDKRVKKRLNQDQVDYSCELKYDGVAISLIYVNGLLEQAVTRGDGVSGDDVTENIKTIKSIPLQLFGDFPQSVELRGEIFITKLDFDKINNDRLVKKSSLKKQYKFDLVNAVNEHDKSIVEKKYIADINKLEPYSNPRNLASGTLKLLDSTKVAKRNLSCIVYSVHSTSLLFDTHMENLLASKKWGFTMSSQLRLARNVTDIMDFINTCESKRDSLPFEIDGIVVKVNNCLQQEILGHTSKSPRWAISYKFKANQTVTILENVQFQVGRTGSVTPVACLKPVKLGGSLIKRASLHNEDFIKKLDLKIGDSVIIEKGGDVIPKIVSVIQEKRNLLCVDIFFSKECPACFKMLYKPESEVNYYCTNFNGCLPQKTGSLEHFISRDALNIQTLGGKTINLLFAEGVIRDVGSLYDLTMNDFIDLKGFGGDSKQKNKPDKKAKNIINSINYSKSTSFDKVLYGLGIRHVGKTVAKKLVYHFKSMVNLMNASREDLLIIDDVGDKIADSILDYCNNSRNQILIDKLVQHGLNFEILEQEKKSNKLNDLIFLITGTFTNSRAAVKSLIELNGGKNTSAISKKTDYLVIGNNFGSKKREKALLLGVKIITEEDLLKMLE